MVDTVQIKLKTSVADASGKFGKIGQIVMWPRSDALNLVASGQAELVPSDQETLINLAGIFGCGLSVPEDMPNLKEFVKQAREAGVKIWKNGKSSI